MQRILYLAYLFRTPLEHGTALDLAAGGKAGNRHLLEAINMAKNLSGQH